MQHKGKKINPPKLNWKSTDGKMANARGSSRSVSREDRPARLVSFVSLTSWLTKNMLFRWKFPVEICKWNNENQICIYTLNHMEALRVLVKKNTHYLFGFTFLLPVYLPWVTAGDNAWAVSTQGWHALFLIFLWLMTNNKLLKMLLIGFRDRDPEGQVSITPSYIGLTIKSTSNQSSAS